ncbi:MAG: hypothetical protein ACYTGG_13650 [Planctomycetota bacterium]|jgi:hypothetical protein
MADPAPGGDAPIIVSAIGSDRFCDRCATNLLGQPVEREPRYDMYIARCPSCGAMAPVQMQVRLARWQGRWAAFLAACWLWFVAFTFLAGSAAVMGLATGTASVVSADWGTWLRVRYEAETAAERAAAAPTGPTVPIPPIPPTGPTTPAVRSAPIPPIAPIVATGPRTTFSDWWATQDAEALLAEAGGWSGAANWYGLHIWWILGAVAGLAGVLWSLLMPGLGRRGRVLWLVLFALLASGLGALVVLLWRGAGPDNPWLVAIARLGPPVVAASLLIGITCAAAGLEFGRGLVRGLAMFILPGRARSVLAILWTIDGLPAPAPPRGVLTR